MKNLAIFGAVALGGYLLYNHFENQAMSVLTPVGNSPTVNNYAKFQISSQTQSEMQSYYTRRWNTLANPTFNGWTYVYGQLYGVQLPQVLNNIGIDPNASYTIGDFASVVNHALSVGNALNGIIDNGLGVLAISNTHRYGMQNHRLPASLELYNAMLR